MEINTSRFGLVEIAPDDIILFPSGLMGFEECRHWVLLADPDNPAVAWLQSVTRPEIAMAVVSPRRFAPHYRVCAGRSQLEPLCLDSADEAYVLAIVSCNERALTLNLKAPVIINLDRLLGRQIITTDDQPLQYEFASQPATLRKSA